MEKSSSSGLFELGIEDCGFIHQWQMNPLDELSILPSTAAFEENLQQYSCTFQAFNLRPSANTYNNGIDRPSKQLKSNNWNSSKPYLTSIPQAAVSQNSATLSFANANNQVMSFMKPKEEAAICAENIHILPADILASQGSFRKQNHAFKACQGSSNKSSTNTARLSQAQDHIMAERKRREKLSQRFIALSAIIPGLKKMDKASVLGDAIKYLKQLQERVKILEEDTRKKTIESVIFVKKSQLSMESDQNSFSDENFSSCPYDEPLPEIEVRFCDKNVLIRIHCEKRKGVLEKTIAEVEKIHLTIINSSLMTFGSSALDVTIIAQMDVEFKMSVKDLVKHLRSVFELLK